MTAGANGAAKFMVGVNEFSPWAQVEEYESRQLVKQLAMAGRSELYAGIEQAGGEFASIAFTEKYQLVESQIGHLFSANLSCEPTEIVLVQGTSGTSGKILRLPFTRNDIASYAESGARAFTTAGVGPGVPVMLSLNYHLYAGGVADHRSVERAGGMCIPVSTGNTARLAKLLRELPVPAILYATPSYAMYLAEAADAADLRRDGWNLARVVLSGEAGGGDPLIRDHLESVFGAPVRDYFGLAEVGAQAAECDRLQGLHWVGHGLVLFELIDPSTGKPISVTAGAVGEPVYTTLTREAAPLVRFRSHDLVEILGMDCDCGRTGPRFRVVGRTDDLIVVRGLNLFPSAVRSVLVDGGFSAAPGRFELIVQDAPPHLLPIILRVESTRDDEEFRLAVAAACKAELNVSFEVEIVGIGTLDRDVQKSKIVRRRYLE